MDAATVSDREHGGSDLLLEHCFALDRPAVETVTPVARLEALIGVEMARRLLLALSARR